MADHDSKRLYLVRHGVATSKEEDPERPLTADGKSAVKRMAEWAVSAGIRVDEIRHSGKLRALQTAELIAERLQPSEGVTEGSGLSPNDDVRPVATELAGDPRTVMLVGHQPFLGRLAAQMVTGNADVSLLVFEAASMAALVQDGNDWYIHTVMQPSRLS